MPCPCYILCDMILCFAINNTGQRPVIDLMPPFQGYGDEAPLFTGLSVLLGGTSRKDAMSIESSRI
jgi:hypothetical protein